MIPTRKMMPLFLGMALMLLLTQVIRAQTTTVDSALLAKPQPAMQPPRRRRAKRMLPGAAVHATRASERPIMRRRRRGIARERTRATSQRRFTWATSTATDAA